MAQHTSVRLEKEERDAIEHMEETNRADNLSEAHRKLLRAGMREYGYENGNMTETALKRFSAEFARAFVWIGLAWLGVTVVAPVEYRLGAVFALFAAVGSSGVYVALDRHEPRVSEWFSGLRGGGKA